MAFTDRSGHQWSNDNYRYLSISTQRSDFRIGGDVLIAGKTCSVGTYTLENNGSYTSSNGTIYTSGASNNEGPGNSEFFKGEIIGLDHFETSQGAMAVLPGTNSLVLTVMDPIVVHSGGIRRLSTIDGTEIAGSSYTIYESLARQADATMSKANGLGDIELVTALPPIEIGNRVWVDADGDGIQDAGESGLAGVEVELVNGIGTVIGTVVTNANGNYIFSTATGTNSTGIVYGVPILPNTTYTVRIKGTVTAGNTITGNAGLNATNYLTLANRVGNGQPDWSDNDGVNTAGSYSTTVTTGNYGQAIATVDFGFANANTLPVTYVSFTAKKINTTSVLNFTIAEDATGSDFAVERSINAINFNTIGNIAGTTATTYSFTDILPVPTTKNYYRIKETDRNGKTNYSEIKVVRFGNDAKVEVFPVPATNTINISFDATLVNKPITVTLYNAQGQKVLSRSITNASATTTLDVGKLTNGVYQLQLIGNNTLIRTANIVIAK